LFYKIHLLHNNNGADDEENRNAELYYNQSLSEREPPLPSFNFPFNAWMEKKQKEKMLDNFLLKIRQPI